MLGRSLLVSPHAHIPVLAALEGLTPEDADARVAGAPHSIAEIVAHMSFWQEWFCRRCDGTHDPLVVRAADGWPEVAPGSWESIRTRFADGLERAASLDSSSTRRVEPPIEFSPLAEYTVRDAIEHMAGHNSHHLGQIVLLRQMLGRWPPPAGSWTW
jgi:uncharacterized damage-inducible protein DinB